MTESKKVRDVLPGKIRFKLMTEIQEQYATMGVTDEEFVKHAIIAVGYPINANHVMHARQLLEIPSTKNKALVPSTIVARLQKLETEFADLLKKLGEK